MPPNIGRHINKTIYISLPALFEDGECRLYTLLGVELTGLWLQSDELTRRLLPGAERDLATTSTAVFVPFAQIAGVLVAGAPSQSPEQQPEQMRSGAAAGESARRRRRRVKP